MGPRISSWRVSAAATASMSYRSDVSHDGPPSSGTSEPSDTGRTPSLWTTYADWIALVSGMQCIVSRPGTNAAAGGKPPSKHLVFSLIVAASNGRRTAVGDCACSPTATRTAALAQPAAILRRVM